MLAATAMHGDPGQWFARLAPDVLSRAGDAGVGQIIEACNELERLTGLAVVIDTRHRSMSSESAARNEGSQNFVMSDGSD